VNTDQLFCWTMVDLDACIRSTWHYHQLRIAGLLRLLVMDGSPLAQQVNRTYRESLHFLYLDGQVHVYPDPEQAADADGFSLAVANLDPRPHMAAGGTPSTAKMDAWLKVPVLRLNEQELTVRTFVEQMAYVEGLVHAGKPRDAFEEELVVWRSALRRQDNLSLIGFDLLRQIGRITYTGLLPLRNHAQAHRHERDGEYPLFDYG
jgi:hypothetical protein